jgi:DNA-binding MarR family transcriptional regulator
VASRSDEPRSDEYLTDESLGELAVQLRLVFRRGRSLAVRLAAEAAPDLDPAVFSVLMAIARAELTHASDVAEHFGIGKAAVSRQLTALVRRGLVERQVDEDDARAFRLALTAEGLRVVGGANESVRRSLREVFAGWDAADAAQFIDYLSRFNDAIR